MSSSREGRNFLDVLRVRPESSEIFDKIVKELADVTSVLNLCRTCKKLRDLAKKRANTWLHSRLLWDRPEEIHVLVSRTEGSLTLDSGRRACQEISVFASSHKCAMIGLKFFLGKLQNTYGTGMRLLERVRRENPQIQYFYFQFDKRQDVPNAKEEFSMLHNIQVQLIFFLTSWIHISSSERDLTSSEHGFLHLARSITQRHPECIIVADLFAKIIQVVSKIEEDFTFRVLKNEDVMIIIEIMRKFRDCKALSFTTTSILKCFNFIVQIYNLNQHCIIFSYVHGILRKECSEHGDEMSDLILENCLKILYQLCHRYPDTRITFHRENINPALVGILRRNLEVGHSRLNVCKKILEVFEEVAKGEFVPDYYNYMHGFSKENITLLQGALDECVERFPDEETLVTCVGNICKNLITRN